MSLSARENSFLGARIGAIANRRLGAAREWSSSSYGKLYKNSGSSACTWLALLHPGIFKPSLTAVIPELPAHHCCP